MQEIERKFLVKQMPPGLDPAQAAVIDQGYVVPGEGGVEVRLRRKGAKHELTIKRKSRENHIEREEHNVPLTPEQWAELWPLTAGRRLRKDRYEIPYGELVIELDIYRGRNEGLAVAEVEFGSMAAAEGFAPAEWFGREVTGEAAYSNPLLAIE